MNFSKMNIITGHYGSGKTNFAVNLALDIARSGKQCTIVDLDIVNPYFRTADFAELFRHNGITLKVPKYANTNLDIPALNFDINSIISESEYVILDVGGDDAGATALGRYAPAIKKLDDVQMLYVVNCFRYLIKKPADAVELMRDIELASDLKCTGIVNNSNMGSETTQADVENSIDYAKQISELSSLPVVCNTVKRDLSTDKLSNTYPVDIYVKAIWNN